MDYCKDCGNEIIVPGHWGKNKVKLQLCDVCYFNLKWHSEWKYECVYSPDQSNKFIEMLKEEEKNANKCGLLYYFA